MNKASVDTKTCQDNRMRDKHRKVMYPAVLKAENTLSEFVQAEKKSARLQTYEKLIGPPRPQNHKHSENFICS